MRTSELVLPLMGTSNKSWVQVFNHIESEVKQQKKKKNQTKSGDGGGERHTEMQLNDDVNGLEVCEARRDFSRPSSATRASWAELSWGREGKAGRKGGVIYWHLSGMNRSKARPDDRWSIRRQIKDGNCPLKLSSSIHSLPGLWNNL